MKKELYRTDSEQVMQNYLLEQMEDGLLLMKDTESGLEIIKVNQALAEATGTKPAAWMHQLSGFFLDQINGNDRGMVVEKIHATIRDRCKTTFECRLKLNQQLMKGTCTFQYENESRQKYLILQLHDISYVKMLRKEAQYEKIKYEATFECGPIPIGTWEFDIKNQLIYNHRLSQPVFLLPDRIENVPYSIIEMGCIAEESVEDFLKMYESIMNGSETVKAQLKLNDRYGNTEWYQFVMRTIFDEDGNPVRALGSSANINYFKNIEEQYKAETESMLSASGYDLLGRCRVNISKDITDCYEGYDNIMIPKTQIRFSDIVQSVTQMCVNEKSAREFTFNMNPKELLRKYRKGISVYQIEYLRRMQGNVNCWVRTIVKIYPDPYHKDIMAFMYTYNINYEKLREGLVEYIIGKEYETVGELTLDTGKLRCIAHSIMDKMMYSELQLDYMTELKSFVDRFCLEEKKEEMIRLLSISYVKNRLETEDYYTCSFTLKSDDTIKRKLYHFAYLNQMKTKIIFTRSDITDAFVEEQKRQDILSKALETAQVAMRAKTEFLSRMSHDIRTPLNAIINITRLAQRNTEDRYVIMNDLKQVETSSKFLLGLINDILEMSKIETGHITLSSEVYTYDEYRNYVNCVIKPLCMEKNITFEWQCGHYPLPIETDITRFNQILFNILSNAVKYTENNGRIQLSEENEWIEGDILYCDFVITDNGIGMSEEFQKKMFVPFEREDQSGHTYEGTGLGLSIVKNLVEIMGGTITIESQLHVGTKVIIHLGLKIAKNAEQEEKPLPSISEQIASAHGRHVLVVEDYRLNREILIRLLQIEEMTYDCAENGKQACKLFARSAPGTYDMILMDIRMPVMDGIAATRWIRACKHPDAQKIPIIAMTANAFAEDRELSKQAGINEHLSKPIEIEQLKAVFARYFDSQA